MGTFKKCKIWGWGTPLFEKLGVKGKILNLYISVPHGFVGAILIPPGKGSIGELHFQSWETVYGCFKKTQNVDHSSLVLRKSGP